jgi:hypothetical protein
MKAPPTEASLLYWAQISRIQHDRALLLVVGKAMDRG